MFVCMFMCKTCRKLHIHFADSNHMSSCYSRWPLCCVLSSPQNCHVFICSMPGIWGLILAPGLRGHRINSKVWCHSKYESWEVSLHLVCLLSVIPTCVSRAPSETYSWMIPSLDVPILKSLMISSLKCDNLEFYYLPQVIWENWQKWEIIWWKSHDLSRTHYQSYLWLWRLSSVIIIIT